MLILVETPGQCETFGCLNNHLLSCLSQWNKTFKTKPTLVTFVRKIVMQYLSLSQFLWQAKMYLFYRAKLNWIHSLFCACFVVINAQVLNSKENPYCQKISINLSQACLSLCAFFWLKKCWYKFCLLDDVSKLKASKVEIQLGFVQKLFQLWQVQVWAIRGHFLPTLNGRKTLQAEPSVLNPNQPYGNLQTSLHFPKPHPKKPQSRSQNFQIQSKNLIQIQTHPQYPVRTRGVCPRPQNWRRMIFQLCQDNLIPVEL